MRPKLRIKFDVQWIVDDYENYHSHLHEIIPESLSAPCPYCQVYSVIRVDALVTDPSLLEGSVVVEDSQLISIFMVGSCPSCEMTLFVQARVEFKRESEETEAEIHAIFPSPKQIKVPPEVPDQIAADFEEAVAVLPVSPKASAALSRRCLEAVLADPNAGNAEQFRLTDKIQHVLPSLPAYIAEQVDAIREIGNFAAHNIKSEHSGEIMDVEPGEAEWNLEVLDMLFDFYYIQPARIQRKRDKVNKKLKEAGRDPLN